MKDWYVVTSNTTAEWLCDGDGPWWGYCSKGHVSAMKAAVDAERQADNGARDIYIVWLTPTQLEHFLANRA